MSAADAFSYRLIATDAGANSATSSVAGLTIAASPAADSYAAMVVANNPLAYYRLNETSGTNVYDYVGDHNGTYEVNAIVGVAGPTNAPFAGFESGNLCLETSSGGLTSWADAPFGTLAGMSNVTFTCWIYPIGVQSDYAGLIVDRTGAGGGGGLGYGGSGNQMLAYNWNTNTADTFISGLVIPSGQWSFCALVIAPDGSTLYLYNTSGLDATNNPIPHLPGVFGNAWHLGNDISANDPSRTFNGKIDEVAIFGSSLSTDQISRLYVTATSGLPRGISIAPSGHNLVLTWFQGVLLQAPALTGPWTTNSAANSPYSVPPTGTQQFYKLLIPILP